MKNLFSKINYIIGSFVNKHYDITYYIALIPMALFLLLFSLTSMNKTTIVDLQVIALAIQGTAAFLCFKYKVLYKRAENIVKIKSQV